MTIGSTGSQTSDSHVDDASRTVTRLTGSRKFAAQQMVRAWEAPVFALSSGVDMTRALAIRSQAAFGTVTDVMIHACSSALSKNPAVNAWYEDWSTVRFQQVNVGIAVATDRGLVVPVLHDLAGRSVSEIAERRRDLVERARNGALQIDDVSGGTFTISNLGMLGVDRFTAILNPPQVAILAVGRPQDRYVRVSDCGEWRPIADLTVTCDHRALDGATAARFLRDVVQSLEI